MNALRDVLYRLNIRSMRDVRENKVIMGGAASLLCLIALVVVLRGFLGGSPPAEPTQADLDGQALVEQLQQENPPAPEPESPPVEPGSGRMMQTMPG